MLSIWNPAIRIQKWMKILERMKKKIHWGEVRNIFRYEIRFLGKWEAELCDFMKEMLESFPIVLGGNDAAPKPVAEDLFGQKGTSAQKIEKRKLKRST